MKPILRMSLLLLFWGCKKDLTPANSAYVRVVKKALYESLGSRDFAALDFSRAARIRGDSVSLYYYRVPFKGKVAQEDFIFLKTNDKGEVEKGKIVHLQGKLSDKEGGTKKRKRWDGIISLSSLDRKTVFTSPIVNGFIADYHSRNPYRTGSQEPQGDVMPEVIITYTITADSEYSWSSWFYLESLFANGGGSGGESGGYYGSFGGGGDGNTGDGGGGSGGGEVVTSDGAFDPVIHIDMEYQNEYEAIDITKFLNCFNAIPDDGATCSIEIMTDIPVDSNPNAIYDIDARSPGHTFLTLSKRNGTQHVTQNIGFYPRSGYKSITYAPVASKLVDNAHHEFNASLRMDVTPARLATALLAIKQYSVPNYDVDEYNCTDFALNVLNAIRAWPLVIPKYGIPGSPLVQATRTPGGLYNKLQEMVNSNDAEKGNITIGIVKGYAGSSTGPCN